MKRFHHIVKLLFLLAVVLPCNQLFAGESVTRIDSLLKVLDNTIERRQQYIDAKHHKIWELKNRLIDPSTKRTQQQELELYRDLTEEYIAFKFDSAFHYASQSIRLAQLVGDSEVETECHITLANILMTGGRFSEALDELNKLDSRKMSRQTKARYYSAYDLTFLHRAKYVGGDDMPIANDWGIRRAYMDSLRQVIEYVPENYRMISRIYVETDQPEVAKEHLKELLSKLKFGTRAYAIVTGTLAYCYEVHPEADARKEYLILSATSDILDAVCENESLRQLALILFEEGDIRRAHQYISLSIADANFYDAHLRCIEAAATYPIIQNAYKEVRDRDMRHLKALTIISISLLVIAVVTGIILLNRMRALHSARAKLTDSNCQLSKMNEHLSETNHIRQKQITQFLVLCSSYINKMEQQQQRTYNLLNLGKIQQLKDSLSSPRMLNQEIKEFYSTFDRLVLKSYPNFVSQINGLLREEERIELGEGEGLTTELRIYALILLGIDDSSQIARFLRYSNNTVYTYRTKMRNKAVDKALFEENIAKIKPY